MRLENSFVVPAPEDRVWAWLVDVERVAPCMPGAEVIGRVDDRTWKGRINVKLGPVALVFAGTVVQEQIDEAARRVVIRAKGTETRGKGMASATVTSQLAAAGEGTRVVVVTDLQIAGAAAQFSRGMMGDVSKRFTDEFADCLATRLGAVAQGGAGTAAEPAVAPTAARPVSGLRLGVWAAFQAARRGVRRIWGSADGA